MQRWPRSYANGHGCMGVTTDYDGHGENEGRGRTSCEYRASDRSNILARESYCYVRRSRGKRGTRAKRTSWRMSRERQIKYSCKANLATVSPAAVQADRWPASHPSPYRPPRAVGYP